MSVWPAVTDCIFILRSQFLRSYVVNEVPTEVGLVNCCFDKEKASEEFL